MGSDRCADDRSALRRWRPNGQRSAGRAGFVFDRYGDQSLFVTKDCFWEAGGFCENHIVMEDYEFIKRLRRYGQFIILPKDVITSSRKYIANGIFRMQAIFYMMYFLYRLGYSQKTLLHIFSQIRSAG